MISVNWTLAEPPTLRLAEDRDRPAIYRLRHDVYANELRQHPANDRGMLSDGLDAFNEYVVMMIGDELVGIVSITPPGNGRYSVDKYVRREDLPFPCDDGLYEVRILTVAEQYRASSIGLVLMHGALRFVESRGGERIMAIGRDEIFGLYCQIGFASHGRPIRSGAVAFELMSAPVAAIREHADAMQESLDLAHVGVTWALPFAKADEEPCFHGGQFFDRVGVDFETLERRDEIVNADVLDAWFPPAPGVIATLHEHLDWILRTSPPTRCEGMVAAIAAARGIPVESVVPGAGSSDLMFASLPVWLTPESRVLILDPMYGEYAFILEERIGCRVDRLTLRREQSYDVDLALLRERATAGYDMIVLVNPNSPTGRHVPREALEAVLRDVPVTTRVWIDETYVDYVSSAQSLERFAVTTPNVVVCKSMSKVYALSGARAAYLCAPPALASALRQSLPPWAVGLPGQVAAVKALADCEYYAGRWRETADLRHGLGEGLRALAIDVVPGVANFLLCHLPVGGLTAADLIAACSRDDVFLRDVSSMGTSVGADTFRVAVKDAPTNARVLASIDRALG